MNFNLLGETKSKFLERINKSFVKHDSDILTWSHAHNAEITYGEPLSYKDFRQYIAKSTSDLKSELDLLYTPAEIAFWAREVK